MAGRRPGALQHRQRRAARGTGLLGRERAAPGNSRWIWPLFYSRIPQIYTSAIQRDNGLVGNFFLLNNNNFFDHQTFPQYPNPLVSCPVNATNCQLPSGLAQLEQADVSAFSHNFKTPKVQQAGLNVEREVAHRLSVGVSYMYVHGVDLIRARDVNLPPPVNVSYPVYDSPGTIFWALTTMSIPSPLCNRRGR